MLKRSLFASFLVLAAAIALVACGGGSPEDTVNDLAAAINEGDDEAACELLTDEVIEEGDGCEDALPTEGDEDIENAGNLASVEVTEETDDTATVEVTIEGEGDEVASEFQLVKEDGDWKVDNEPDFD